MLFRWASKIRDEVKVENLFWNNVKFFQKFKKIGKNASQYGKSVFSLLNVLFYRQFGKKVFKGKN